MTLVSSTWYGHVILASGYFVLTAVNWLWNKSPISNYKDVSCMHKLTQVDLCIFFRHHLAQLCRLITPSKTTSEPAIWSCDIGQQVTCFDSCQLTWISNAINLMWTFKWPYVYQGRMAEVAILVYTAVVGDSTHLRAIPLAMLTMKKEMLGFHNFYAWFSSVSPISIGMGLHSPAHWAGEAPLLDLQIPVCSKT